MGFWLWGCFEIDKVSSIGEHTLFGIPTTVKQIDYYYTCDTTDTTARLHIYTDKLAEGFGVIYRGGGNTFYDMFLRAARIDGVVYGDTTVVSVLDEGNRNRPQDYHLFRNYSNPFNSFTVIRYSLQVSSP